MNARTTLSRHFKNTCAYAPQEEQALSIHNEQLNRRTNVQQKYKYNHSMHSIFLTYIVFFSSNDYYGHYYLICGKFS